MSRRRRDNPKPEAPGKRGRDLIRAVAAAGGTVRLTAKGHLRVAGPQGVTFVGIHRTTDWRAQLNALADIRRYTGLKV